MHTTLENLLASLNEEQSKAVYPETGTMLVCAGAGSGKTRIIIARIAYLISQGVPPETIIAVTFTNKAAREMKDRLHALLPTSHALPYIGTFHSFCLYTLKKYANLLGISDFSLLDDVDQRKLVHAILKRAQLEKEYRTRSVMGYISHRKNRYYQADDQETNPTLEEIYQTYEREKAAAQCYDFDDLLLEVVRHLDTQSQFRHMLHTYAQHILVDEYQDTNQIQHELLKLLAQENGETRATSMCVVGDEDQSIYRWRGATVQNFVCFDTDFPETQRYTITQNYRSCQTILASANTVIQNNTQRYAKQLWSQKDGHDRLLLAHCTSHIQEGQLIAHAARSCLNGGNQPGILYRSHHQSRAIEEALMQHNIPYVIIGGTEFYQRQEIKDVLAYLKLVTNPYDHISWSRICNVPSRGLGTKFQDQFLTAWRNTPFADHFEISKQLRDDLSPRKAQLLDQLCNIFDGLTPDQPARDVCTTILDRADYKQFLFNTLEHDEAQEKIENINELERALAARAEVTVREFLEEVTLMQHQHAQQTDEQCAQLMTLHAAKGLEFHTVLISGLEEHVFPSTRARNDDASLEEERRLFYVGLTRAQEYVMMTYTAYRATFGSLNDNPPSRFIAELPDTFVRHVDFKRTEDTQMQGYVTRWLHGQTTSLDHTSSEDLPYQYQAATSAEDTQTATDPQLQRGDRVKHTKFGTGTIQHVWRKSGQTYLFVKFTSQVKKLDARFVTPL